uniref:hypothetical protein n=1 Tax=Klebsiella variicola TaxID=244366 RepID=UPI00396CDB52
MPCELPTVLAALLSAVVTSVAFSDELPTLKPTPPVPEKPLCFSLRRWFSWRRSSAVVMVRLRPAARLTS